MFGKKRSEAANAKDIDVNRPVENPELKTMIQKFLSERSEENAIELGRKLNNAIFLVAIITDEMQMTKEPNGTAMVNKGSIIKFMNCFNENNECFLALFTDWEEIRLWTTEDVSGLIMPAKDAWKFVLHESANYQGIVINPASIGWTLGHENIKNLLEDSQEKE